MKSITVYDIAKEANVSVATVSRVLNNTAPVKKETRDRINQLIAKHQFQPNALARSLFKKATGMLGIILPDITNPFFPEVLSGFDKEARRRGYTYFLCDTVSSNEDSVDQYTRETQYLGVLLEKQVDGIVMLGGRIDLARPQPDLVQDVLEAGKRVPLVLINGNLPGTRIHRVMADERLGASLATQHLIDLGHTDIALIGGYLGMTNTVQRKQGFLRTMKDNGLAANPDWLLHGGFTVEKGRLFTEQLLRQPVRPTAIVCMNDLVAIGALKAAHQAGVCVPDELSITGYDDIPFSVNSIPELTTVSLKAEELGHTAALMLHRVITKEKTPLTVTLKPELKVRGTTAPRPLRT